MRSEEEIIRKITQLKVEKGRTRYHEGSKKERKQIQGQIDILEWVFNGSPTLNTAESPPHKEKHKRFYSWYVQKYGGLPWEPPVENQIDEYNMNIVKNLVEYVEDCVKEFLA